VDINPVEMALVEFPPLDGTRPLPAAQLIDFFVTSRLMGHLNPTPGSRDLPARAIRREPAREVNHARAPFAGGRGGALAGTLDGLGGKRAA
jgi:hypothetical protein